MTLTQQPDPQLKKQVDNAFHVARNESDEDTTIDHALPSLLHYAYKILTTHSSDEKARYTMKAYTQYHHHQLPIFPTPSSTSTVASSTSSPLSLTIPQPPTKPSRPLDIQVVSPSETVKPIKNNIPGERIRLIHSLCHIESCAIDLSWDLLFRYCHTVNTVKSESGRNTHHVLLPNEYYERWLQVAYEEATHYRIWRNRLKELNSHYGALVVHDGLWQSCTDTSHDLLARCSIVHMLHEAHGLDTSIRDVNKFKSTLQDKYSAALLQRIELDEINHVKAGLDTFLYVCQNIKPTPLDPISTFHRYAKQYWHGTVRGPFNKEARTAAGLCEAWYLPLTTAANATTATTQPSTSSVTSSSPTVNNAGMDTTTTPTITKVSPTDTSQIPLNQLNRSHHSTDTDNTTPAASDYIIREYDVNVDQCLTDWRDIGYEWLNKYYVCEQCDVEMMNNPIELVLKRGGYIWLIYPNNAPNNTPAAGTVCLMPVNDHYSEPTKTYEICKLGVRPEAQRRGYGRLLLEHAIQQAHELKAQRIILESNTQLTSALSLYKALGFTPIKDYKSKYERCDIVMELRFNNQNDNNASVKAGDNKSMHSVEERKDQEGDAHDQINTLHKHQSSYTRAPSASSPSSPVPFKVIRNFSDYNQLCEIEKRAASRFSSIYPDYDKWPLITVDEYNEYAKKQMLWVAVSSDSENESMIAYGFVVCDLLFNSDTNQFMLHITEIDVNPSYQRKGIGNELLNQVILYALQNHIPVLTLRTFFTCEWGISLYEKLGFIECDDLRFTHIPSYIVKEREQGLQVDDRCTMYLPMQ